MKYSSDVCVIGGGIAGLALARRLSRDGARVVVVERGRAGFGAGYAAAGMLAPYVEARLGEVDLEQFGREALEFYPGFVADIEAESGIDVDYRSEGTLTTAIDRDDLEQIRHLYQELQALGLPVEWLSGYECRAMEPYLAPNVPGGIFSPDDHQVDNRSLLRALRGTCDLRGFITILENQEEGHFYSEGSRAVGYVVAENDIRADTFILATGARSELLRSIAPELADALRPIKGQIIRLDARRTPLLDHVLRTPDVYLAPKSDGTLVVGASVEERGFDESITAGEVFELLRAARECVPSVHELPILETTVGFRPATIDHLPMLGPSGYDGVWLAMGYYRHGILFSPYAAEILAQGLIEGVNSRWLEEFNPQRFSALRFDAQQSNATPTQR